MHDSEARDGATDDQARRLLHAIHRGSRVDPLLRRLLLDALTGGVGDRPANPEALVSDNARAAAQWVGANPGERGEAVRDLLELSDALPPINGSAAIGFPDKLIAVHAALGREQIPYAVGGAIALGFYAVPRATTDIDLNIFLPADEWPRVRDALMPLGAEAPLGPKPNGDGEAKLTWEGREIHLFLSCDELHTAMAVAVRWVPFADTTIPIVSPEHLIVRKAMLNRPKDWLDIEQILVATSPFELSEVETWLKAMVGEQNPRFARLREIADGLELSGP